MFRRGKKVGFLVILSAVIGLPFFYLGAKPLSVPPKPSATLESSPSSGQATLSFEAASPEAAPPKATLQAVESEESGARAISSGGFIPPKAGYWIEVAVGTQKMRIYLDGELKKEWTVSTGKPETPTPLGVFAVQNRGEWFFSSKYKQGAKWWVSFKDWGVYLFHSVPMDEQQQILPAEARKLGTPASHGCVRLEVDNAKWVYDNIPQGTPVYIHE